ncbi:MAG: tRNA pseudouridine(55) synthase TruB [Erysipelotrichaceae bacterium]|nr:tRNA pseudouridine(55) synthase TruB [Erysipelotrichaceae bacterium]
MDKIIVVNKSIGMTSHDVVNKIRRIFNTKKVGHTGTLDPDASGVLVVCINEATKLVQFLENDSKEYIAEILIGRSTDTFDKTGNTTNDVTVNLLTNEEVDNCLKMFVGKIEQFPPIYSAIKVNGKKLYEYARKNEIVEIKPRNVEIFELSRISNVIKEENYYKFSIKTLVSKGTYIRSLCVDIAKKLGYPGLMNSLIRTKCGVWRIEKSNTLDEISMGKFNCYSMLETLKNYVLIDDDDCIYKALHGMKISPSKIKEIIGETPERIVIKKEDKLIAIYELDKTIYGYKAVRVWN